MTERRIEQILSEIKPLASEYRRLTGKPLGVTGEIAEYVAAQTLGLELASARMAGYDATRVVDGNTVRVQIKGRVVGQYSSRSQRLGKISRDAACDIVMLILLDDDFNATEIWEAPYDEVVKLLGRPGSKARDRGQLGLAAFKKLARRVWRSPIAVDQT